MSEDPTSAPPGWYPEPGTGLNRYWDGQTWGAYAPVPAHEGGQLQKPHKDKVAAGILGILLGGFGIHKFYLGYTSPGLIMLLCSIAGWVLSCLMFPMVLPIAFGVIGLIEGIIYLTKSDAEFDAIYVQGTKEWF